jgi:hypothetical protein
MRDLIIYRSLSKQEYSPMKSNMRNEISDFETRPPKFRLVELQDSSGLAVFSLSASWRKDRRGRKLDDKI